MSTSRPAVAGPGSLWHKAPVPDFEHVARAAARRAGAVLRDRYGQPQEVAYKSDIDLVTSADRETERIVVETIADAFPQHSIVAEESPAKAGHGDHCWYVDPIDGTTNFAHGHPHFAVSIALARGDELLLGLVHDPIRDETFTARRGAGAQLNDVAIRVSDVRLLREALLGTGFPYDHRRHIDFHLAFWREALQRAQGVRRAGSAALDLCYVACGRLDGFWESRLRPWDVAAGRLIVSEAGGRVSDFAGGGHRLSGEETVASNGHIHGELLRMIGDVRQRVDRPEESPGRHVEG